MLLKVVLFAYSQGIVSSRGIERACRDHVTFMALSGDIAPHFTTIADFVSGREHDIVQVFAAVLAICQRQGLIGQEMFAIDGVKLPGNASKARSGTRADFQKQLQKLEGAAVVMLQRHREQDDKPIEPDLAAKAHKRLESLQHEAQQVRTWLAEHPQDRKGPSGAIRKSNRTDNQSAKMATSKGEIQGCTGVAAVDAKHQIIVEAQAHGTGSEQELLLPVVEAMKGVLTRASVVTADSGYHSEKNLQNLEAQHIDALIVDHDMRKRDERFATQGRHQQGPDHLHDKRPKRDKSVGERAWPLVRRPVECYRRRWISGSTSSITVFSLIALPSAVSRRRSSSVAVSFSPQTNATRTFLPTAASAARRMGGISPMVS